MWCILFTLQYFQSVHGMLAVLQDFQVKTLSEVFQTGKFQISRSKIPVSSERKVSAALLHWHDTAQQENASSPVSVAGLVLPWEDVVTAEPQGLHVPRPEFLRNIQQYKYNRFITIGNPHGFLSKLQMYFICRNVPKLSMAIQRYLSGNKTTIDIQNRHPELCRSLFRWFEIPH